MNANDIRFVVETDDPLKNTDSGFLAHADVGMKFRNWDMVSSQFRAILFPTSDE